MTADIGGLDGILLDGERASYDRAAKRLLSFKSILAWILKYVAEEFKDISIEDIANTCIEGEPALSIGQTPVEPDLTNAASPTGANSLRAGKDEAPQKIKGARNEDGSPTEGTVVFDILFRARVPKTGEAVALIVNIEPQKNARTGYPLLRRALYYACRLVSAQKETEFHGSDFARIKKVYTIWLIMDAPKGKGNAIRRYQIRETLLHGRGREEKRHYDLITAVMIYLGTDRTGHRLLRLLHLIFLKKLRAAEKKEILQKDYGLEISPGMEKELVHMGGLIDVFAERALREGLRRGERRGARRGERRGIQIGEQRGIQIGEQRGIQIGERRGIQIGERQGMRRGILSALQTMMETLELTAQQAMDALCIPAAERAEYSAQLQKKNAPRSPEPR